MLNRSAALFAVLITLSCAPVIHAADIHIGVASNFAPTLKGLLQAFERRTGHRVILSSGSSGKLYTQVKHGAPFDLFFSADAERPRRLEAEGEGVSGTRATYCLGRLVLWSQGALVDNEGKVLSTKAYRKLAMANPVTAPYGLAAMQVMQKTGVWDAVQDRIVVGENIAQTWQFVASGNANLGFVALSQLRAAGSDKGSAWHVPSHLHDPIEQQVILLRNAREAKAARQLLHYLESDEARNMLRKFGYDLPGS